MKRKLFLIAALTLLGGTRMKAQTFDEADLVGIWTRSEPMQPVDKYLISVDKLDLRVGVRTYTYSDGDTYTSYSSGFFQGQWNTNDGIISEWEDFDNKVLEEFSITNGDKLHLQFDGWPITLIFKIAKLTSSELVIQPLGSDNLIFFNKTSGATASINHAKTSSTSVTTTYNINGQRRHGKLKGINIVKTGNTVYKELAK